MTESTVPGQTAPAAPSVYVARRLPAEALAILEDRFQVELWPEAGQPVPRAELLAKIQGKDAVLTLVTDRVDREFLDAAGSRLRVVANMAVGVDNIDLEACRERGVIVTNTPDVLTETTADLVWALLLAAARRVVEGHQLIQRGQWQSWHPMFMTGQDVHGKVLGIVGAGRIGSAVARRAQGFNMTVLYHNRRRNHQLEAAVGATYANFDQLLQEADFIVCMLPLTDETAGLFGAREFALMKPTAVFVNAARGAIVDEDALVHALKTGQIWAAGLDVFAKEPIGPDHPLLALPNCVCLPHIGSASIETRLAMATLAARNVAAVLSGQEPLTPVVP